MAQLSRFGAQAGQGLRKLSNPMVIRVSLECPDGEHEVSLLSAASVLKAIDKNKFEVVPIGITKQGRWLTASDAEKLLRGEKTDPAFPPNPDKAVLNQ